MGSCSKKKQLMVILLVMALALAALTACSETKENGRFAVAKGQENIGEGWRVYVDTETGCCYLFVKAGYGGGLCQLTDAEGNPLLVGVGR